MQTDIFEKELLKIRKRFNQTFGRQIVCDLRTRQQVILAIVHMGILARKISESRMTNETRTIIQRLIKVRDTLNDIFDKVEDAWAERRDYDAMRNRFNRQKNGSNRGRRIDQDMSALRQPIRTGVAAARR